MGSNRKKQLHPTKYRATIKIMKEYQPKEFTIPVIKGISEKTIETHLGLYKGYVTNLNTQYQKIKEVCGQEGDTAAIVSALTRRIPFELAGVKNHEHYFGALEGGPAMPNESSAFSAVIKEQFNSLDAFKKAVQHTAAVMRGGRMGDGRLRQHARCTAYLLDSRPRIRKCKYTNSACYRYVGTFIYD